MTVQRRRNARTLILYPSKLTTDSRGNEIYLPDFDNPITVLAWGYPQRSTRGEVPGQLEIDVTRVGVGAGEDPFSEDLANVSLWSRAVWDGREWDVVSPPSLHWGTRRVRHWEMDLRGRPSGQDRDHG